MVCVEPKIVIKAFLSLDGMVLSLNLLLVYLTFRSKSGGVPLEENFWYLRNYSWNIGSINKISLE